MSCNDIRDTHFSALKIDPCPVVHVGLVFEKMPGEKPRYRCTDCGHVLKRKKAKREIKQIHKLNRLGWREYMRRRELKHPKK